VCEGGMGLGDPDLLKDVFQVVQVYVEVVESHDVSPQM
jgi:hypothetical protein